MIYTPDTRVAFDYLPETSNEIIRVEGVVVKNGPNVKNPNTHFTVKLDTPRVRHDSPRPQLYITIRVGGIQEKFALVA